MEGYNTGGHLPRGLLSLAEELILEIIEQIDDLQTIKNLCLVSGQLRQLAEPYLYREIFIQKGPQASTFRRVIAARPERAFAVRHLAVRYKHENEKGIETFDQICDQLGNLKTLDLETPCPNDALQQSLSGGLVQYWLHIDKFSSLQSSLYTLICTYASHMADIL
jgi:hypothetical protein